MVRLAAAEAAVVVDEEVPAIPARRVVVVDEAQTSARVRVRQSERYEYGSNAPNMSKLFGSHYLSKATCLALYLLLTESSLG